LSGLLRIIYMLLAIPLRSMGVTAGVYLTGTANVENESSLKQTFIWAIVPQVVTELMVYLSPPAQYSSLIASYLWFTIVSCIHGYRRNETWAKLPQLRTRKSFCLRLSYQTLAYLLFLFLFCSNFYHNLEFTTRDQNKVKLKDAIHNLRQSPEWHKFWETLRQVYNETRKEGWQKTYSQFINSVDIDGRDRALHTLGLKDGSRSRSGRDGGSKQPSLTLSEIKHARNKLALQYHPDKQKDKSEEERRMAEQKFRDIQGAYEILEKLYS